MQSNDVWRQTRRYITKRCFIVCKNETKNIREKISHLPTPTPPPSLDLSLLATGLLPSRLFITFCSRGKFIPFILENLIELTLL